MSSTTTTTADNSVETGWSPNPNLEHETISLKNALVTAIPIIVIVSVMIGMCQWCRVRHYRQQMRLRRLYVIYEPEEMEEGKPALYDVYIDSRRSVSMAEEGGWRDIKPLSATLVNPQPPDPITETNEPLAPEALMIDQVRHVARIAKEVVKPKPLPVPAVEDDLTLVAGVILRMPSPESATYYPTLRREEPIQDNQLPELVFGCEEVPWRGEVSELPPIAPQPP